MEEGKERGNKKTVSSEKPDIVPAPQGKNNVINTTLPENNVIFYVGGDKEVLRLEENGDILIKGNLAENDKQVVDALREFITETVVGRITNAKDSVWFKQELEKAFNAAYIRPAITFENWYENKYNK